MEDRSRERRLRRAADRQGLRLERSPRRDPRALDYGRYRLVYAPPASEIRAGRRRPVRVAFGDPHGAYALTVDEVERYLRGDL